MFNKISLVTKRKDIILLCQVLLPTCEVNAVSSLDDSLKKLPDIIADASFFESIQQLQYFSSLVSCKRVVLLVTTELNPSFKNYFSKNFPLTFHFPSDSKSLVSLLNEARKKELFDADCQSDENSSSTIYGYFSGISESITKVRKQMRIAAKVDSPVLLLGETGTGKTTAAKLIFLMSPRSQNKFYLRSLPSITESLMESELFGIKKGTCTGVDNTRDGILMSAQGGVLFLDEIGTASIKQQKMLLPLLDSGTFSKVGSNEKELLDIRWIFGTNIKIKESINDGSFCADLFYRINTNTIEIPSLSHRKEDIPYMVERYLLKSNKKVTELGIEKLMEYDWPGNVRQLNTCLENAKNKSKGEFITEDDINIEKIDLY